MKCPNPECGNVFDVKLASKALIKGARMMTSITSIITVKCDKCHSVFQIPLQGQSVMSVKKD